MYDADVHISAKTDVPDCATSCWAQTQSSSESELAESGVGAETSPSGPAGSSGEVAAG
jgi:hypothetical protein